MDAATLLRAAADLRHRVNLGDYAALEQVRAGQGRRGGRGEARQRGGEARQRG